MTPTNDQLSVLRRLRTDGQITDEEFENLAGGLYRSNGGVSDDTHEADRDVAPPADAAESEDAHEHDDTSDLVASETEEGEDGSPDVEGDDEPGESLAIPAPTLRKNLSPNYLGGLLVASLALLLGSLFGVLSLWVTIPAILVLLSTLIDGWHLVTLGGAAAVAAILMVSLAVSPSEEPEVTPQAFVADEQPDPYPPIPGSLGIYMDQIPELWNTVDAPPSINRGLTRHNEIGEYDTFIYRFGEWGRVAGAYDPNNDAIYALLVTGTFSGPATDQLHLHLCFLVAPYSPECIDSFYEQGLDGGALEDFVDTAHSAEWALGDHVWRLQIEDNVMTVRVYGADAA